MLHSVAMQDVHHVSADVLEAGLRSITESPRTEGILELIVSRPGVGLREVADTAWLDTVVGLVGDTWKERGSSRTTDGSANPDTQLTLMNSRAIALIAGTPARWALAGDQLYVDLDLGTENLPTGSRLRIGEGVIEITAEPHTGCAKFKARYGAPAVAFVNSPSGRAHRLRGLNARIITGGVIRVGD